MRTGLLADAPAAIEPPARAFHAEWPRVPGARTLDEGAARFEAGGRRDGRALAAERRDS
jgi:hypothetical protein